jgi:hypothetical protein
MTVYILTLSAISALLKFKKNTAFLELNYLFL